MKIKILLFALSSLFCNLVFGQKAWRPNRQHLKKNHKPNVNTGAAYNTYPIASNRSTMNEQWNKLAAGIIPENEEVYSIKMVDENITWMVSCPSLFGPPSGAAPSIFKSLNGGMTWDQFQIPNTDGFYTIDIAPISDSIAYVTLWGPNSFDDLSEDIIYKTIDGGQTWEPVTTYPFAPSYIHFFDDQYGWVMGLDSDFLITMSTTIDGGKTWEHAGGNDWFIPEGMDFPELDENEFVGTWTDSPSSNYAVAGSTIIVGGTNYWITHDRGLNWKRLESPLYTLDGLVHGVVAIKDSLTYMFASNVDVDFFFRPATTYGTLDGGQTWTKSIVPINPSAIEYLPGTANDFVITGIDQGFNPDFGYGITGTARTSDIENWDILQNIGLQATDFIGENLGVGAFANYPGLVDGTIYNWGEAVILPFDATINRNNEYIYTIVTLNHLEEEVNFEYQLQNVGLEVLDNTQAKMMVFKDGELVFVDSIELDILADDAEVFTFSYLPDAIGLYEFDISVSHAEIGAAFFKDRRFLEVSATTLAKDDGLASLAFSLDPEREIFPYGFFGSEFKLLTEDKLNAISTVLDFPSSDSSSTFQFLIKAIDEEGTVADEDVYKSEPIPAVEAFTLDFSHVVFPLPEPITLTAGRYIFAVGQEDRQGLVAFDLTDQTNAGAWMYSEIGFGGEPLPWTNFPNDPTLMIRPHFEANRSTSTTDLFAETIPLIVYPNPFQEELNILLEYFEEQEVRLQIFDMSGKLYKHTLANHHQIIQQNVSDLPKGVYLLKLTSGQYQKSLKVIKQ